MKKLLILTMALAGTHQLFAAEIDSHVIHDYSFIGLGYQYGYGDGGPDTHGGNAVVSYDLHNFLFSLSGGYSEAGGNPDFDTWSVSGALGYVFRLQENHINIIPNFGIGYSRTRSSFRIPFYPFVFNNNIDTTAIAPGISLSYAFNNRLSLNVGYAYGYDLNTHDDAHSYFVGGEIAVTDRIGMEVSAHFVDHQGFAGAGAGVSFHF